MNIDYKDLGSAELARFCEYLADYITEELDRANLDYHVDRFTVENAVSAYIGGAADN